LVFVRHAQSEYNALKARKDASEHYQQFIAEFESDLRSQSCQDMADAVSKEFSLGCSDRETPITDAGLSQAAQTGLALSRTLEAPEVVIVSPYRRTENTLAQMARSWPALGEARTYREERVRELDHGLSLLYNDWRVFQTRHPEQRDLQKLLGPYDYRYPNGENIPDVRLRIQSWLASVIREFAGKRVLVVTHHLTILAVRATLERLSPEEFKELDEKEKPVNCGVTIYEGDPTAGRGGRLILKEYNTKHY
jgi:broad specificity phosphatase PhoE